MPRARLTALDELISEYETPYSLHTVSARTTSSMARPGNCVAIVRNLRRSPLPSIMSLLKKRSGSSRAKRKLADISKDAVESDSAVSDSDSSSDPDSGSEAEDPPVREVETVADEPDEPVLSHAERRKRKKRKLNSGDATPGEIPAPSRPKRVRERGGRKSGEVSEGGDALPKRQNSVWVGNLAYKTTPVTLKAFFEGLEVTRINMPSKPPPNGVGPKINSG